MWLFQCLILPFLLYVSLLQKVFDLCLPQGVLGTLQALVTLDLDFVHGFPLLEPQCLRKGPSCWSWEPSSGLSRMLAILDLEGGVRDLCPTLLLLCCVTLDNPPTSGNFTSLSYRGRITSLWHNATQPLFILLQSHASKCDFATFPLKIRVHFPTR